MDYQTALQYLYSLTDYEKERIARYDPETLDLSRVQRVLARLGDPQQRFASVHVAGTKGKGSVAAMCASVLRSAGLRTGLYTSPHLQDYAERIQVDGIPIPHDDLIDLVDEIKSNIAASPEITTFEITTALALLYFSRLNVDVAVLEVGLGGRLDATNVCEPDVTVITSISYDHTYLLGDTLAEIAAEKAGIIKPGIPLVLSPQVPEARESILRIAEERSAPVFEIGKDYLFHPLDKSLSGQGIEVWAAPATEQDSSQVDLSIPLLGDHQLVNAATAYATMMVAKENGIKVSASGIKEGFKSVHWPGRFELLRQDPALIIDSAHNRDSAQKLYRVLEDNFPGQKVVLVFGASEDKDIKGMLSELKPAVHKVVMTQSTHPRAADPEDLAAIAEQLNCHAIARGSVEAGMEEAERLADGQRIILVTGSIFVAAAARSVWMAAEREKVLAAIGK